MDAVLATPLSQALDKSAEMALTGLFTTGSSLILWLLLLFYFSEILELRGKHLLLAGYGILDIVSIVILLILLNTGNTTTALSLSLVLGTAAGGIVLGILACLRMKTLAGSVANTGNSHRKLLCLRIAGFGLEDLPAPSGAMVTVLLELVITGAVYWFCF